MTSALDSVRDMLAGLSETSGFACFSGCIEKDYLALEDTARMGGGLGGVGTLGTPVRRDPAEFGMSSERQAEP